jgi:TM2 domain-containing membrane protein YozV
MSSNLTVSGSQALTNDTQALMLFDAHKKSVAVGYLLWFFLGFLGGHRFYFKRAGSAVAILLLTIFGWILAIVGVGLVFLAIVGIWVLVDAFLIPGWARDHNIRSWL